MFNENNELCHTPEREVSVQASPDPDFVDVQDLQPRYTPVNYFNP
ncbi:hypothetical protein PI124_g8834 [Phytophthora idaei]|nr:hypothetical protein PI126_g5536 [Phytophthora idaei]KAG3246438.1 hypothetical protein PI124_g8834 [Phytophthora idaei]